MAKCIEVTGSYASERYTESDLPGAIPCNSGFSQQSGGFLYEYYLGFVPPNNDRYYRTYDGSKPFAFP
jgi:hypothetical protein